MRLIALLLLSWFAGLAPAAEPIRTPIDRFILSALKARSLSLSPEADRATLIRRVSFDLTGLPPTPAEIDAFLADTAPGRLRADGRALSGLAALRRALGQVLARRRRLRRLQRLLQRRQRPAAGLAVPRLRHPLLQRRQAVRPVRPRAAGRRRVGRLPAGRRRRPRRWSSCWSPRTSCATPQTAPARATATPTRSAPTASPCWKGTLQIIVNCLLGLTIQCARCHDHKFEPVTQKEYYRLQAIFFPGLQPRPLDEAERPRRHRGRPGRPRRASKRRTERDRPRGEGAVRDELARSPLSDSRRRRTSRSSRTTSWRSVAADFATPTRKDSQGDRPHATDRRRRWKACRCSSNDPKPPAHPSVARPAQHAGREVEPGVLAAFCRPDNRLPAGAASGGASSTGRRLHGALADVARLAAEPLLARVHGQPRSGSTTSAPASSHARQPRPLRRQADSPGTARLPGRGVQRDGWSVKALHRLILISAVYRQSSAPAAEAGGSIPTTGCLAAFRCAGLTPRRCATRCSPSSGELDDRAGGPYVPTDRTGEGDVVVDENAGRGGARSTCSSGARRSPPSSSCSTPVDRDHLQPAGHLDRAAPVAGPAQLGVRPPRARRWPTAWSSEAGATTPKRLDAGVPARRRPRAAGRGGSGAAIPGRRSRRCTRAEGRRRGGWADLCQMLLASNAFLYVE